MRRFVLLALVVGVLLMVFVPDSSEPSMQNNRAPIDQASERAGAWQVFKGLITASRDALYLLAQLGLDLLKKGWDATPARLRVIYGVFLACTGILAFVGLWSLLTLSRLPD